MHPTSNPLAHSAAVRGLAAALVALTFLLIFWGGQVTTTESGDSVPDWPWSFFKPENTKQMWELSHRWLGMAVGLAAIGLTGLVLRGDASRGLRRFAIFVTVLIGVQGLIGGLRVKLGLQHNNAVSVLHAVNAQFVLGCVVAFAAILRARPGGVAPVPLLARGAFAFAAVAWFQGLLGAVLRHVTRDEHPWGLALHIGGALAVIVFAVRLLTGMGDGLRRDARFRIPTIGLAALLIAQIVLGLGAYVTTHSPQGYLNPMDARSLIPTLHVVVASAILALAVLIGVRASGRTAAVTP